MLCREWVYIMNKYILGQLLYLEAFFRSFALDFVQSSNTSLKGLFTNFEYITVFQQKKHFLWKVDKTTLTRDSEKLGCSKAVRPSTDVYTIL